MARHVDRMRRGGGNFAIVFGGHESVRRERRGIAGMNDVMHYAGMVGVLREQRRQHGHRLAIQRQTVVIGCDGSQERQRVERTRIGVFGVVLMELAHGGGVSLDALRIVARAWLVEIAQRGHVLALARTVRRVRLRRLHFSPPFGDGALVGRCQIWWYKLIAAPQCAIAQFGSALAICSNWRCASWYQKSCSNATPRTK